MGAYFARGIKAILSIIDRIWLGMQASVSSRQQLEKHMQSVFDSIALLACCGLLFDR